MKNDIPFKTSREAIPQMETCPIALGETKDCWVRAMAAAFKVPYAQAHEVAAKQFGRQPRQGTRAVEPTMAKLNHTLFGRQLRKLTPEERTTRYVNYGQVVTRQMTVKTFLKQYPTGVFILLVRGHAFRIDNGVVIGNTSDASKLRVRLEAAWQVN
jgi:hypothetical protein